MSTIRMHLARTTLPSAVRNFVRSRISGLVLASAVIGGISGGLVVLISVTVQFLHVTLFGLPHGEHLSVASDLAPWRGVLVPVVGGCVLALLVGVARPLTGRLADAIEANALYGGRLSIRGSLFVTAQTMLSSGFGGSVGLEAGYTQMGAALASKLGITLAARRSDMRLLVACGAAGAIAGAFNAPLAGAFYGFEVVLGTYTVGALAPVAASALVACLITHEYAEPVFLIQPNTLASMDVSDIAHVGLISAAAALVGIVLMRAVGSTEGLYSRFRVDPRVRPIVGGLLIGLLSLATPQVLGAGHGALQVDLKAAIVPLGIVMLIGLKCLASAISLGSGFRGGLFYASLLLGALVGRLYVDVGTRFIPGFGLNADLAAVSGMVAFGTGVIGSPIAMTAPALETTGNFAVTLAALIAATVASLIVREIFGYSFATWRFHLRGEAIRGPHDVGWMRDLAVRQLMRTDVRTVPATTTVEQARTSFPIGSMKHVAAVDEQNRYAGLVVLDDLYTTDLDTKTPISAVMRHPDAVLLPYMTVREALDIFETAESDALVVVDQTTTRRIIGALSESYALRAYGRALERQSPDNVTTFRSPGSLPTG